MVVVHMTTREKMMYILTSFFTLFFVRHWKSAKFKVQKEDQPSHFSKQSEKVHEQKG